MTDLVRLELHDPDAIVRGDGRNEDGLTRLDVLRRAALGGSALIGGGLLVSGVPAAYGQSAARDVEILNFLLLNESLEVAFYTEALARAGLTGRLLAFVKQVRANEIVHRDTVSGALGRSARPLPAFSFGDATANPANVLATALALENDDVVANNGAGPLLRSKPLLAVAGQIVSVEARQAAWIRRIAYGPDYDGPAQHPAPQAFDAGIPPPEAQRRVAALGFVQDGA